MISEKEFNKLYSEFKKAKGEKNADNDKKRFIGAFKGFKMLIMRIDPECEAAIEIDKLLDKYEKDDDLYHLLLNIPKKFTSFDIPDDHYIKDLYTKMKNELKRRN